MTGPSGAPPRDPALAGYWSSPWPAEDGGPRRLQQARPAPGFAPGFALRPGDELAVTTRPAFMACMPVLREPGEVYLQGNEMSMPDTTGWVERIDPVTLESVERSPDLPGGPFWAGGLAAHANGSIHVVYGRWAHRLDAATLEPVAARELPRDRAYNSFVVLPTGHLVTKDFGGGDGVHALAHGEGVELCVLEPEGLEIVSRTELPEGSIARLSADVAADGTPLVYVIGDTHVFRLAFDTDSSRLVLDDAWTTRYRVFEGQTFGWDVVLTATDAWFLDDGEGTTGFGGCFTGKGISPAPLHLVRVPVTGGPPIHTEICGRPNGIIANPPLVDAERRIVVGYDSSNAVMAAFAYDDDPSTPLEPLWSVDQHQAGHMVLLPEHGQFVSYDYDATAATDQVVVRDLTSGRELGRAPTGSPVQCVVFPSVGWERDLYITTFTTLARVTVA